jgi:predicted enzyme related to lactoylglutathione lyase
MRETLSIPAFALVLSLLAASSAPQGTAEAVATAPESGNAAEIGQGMFTGEVLPVLYVTDVKRSVEFYRQLGFEFRHYFDYDEEKEVPEWTKDDPPIWALFAAGDFSFALHLTLNTDEFIVGGTRHYFLVEDIDAHHRTVTERGVEPGPLIERPWMRMFQVIDPDGHELFFGTRPD